MGGAGEELNLSNQMEELNGASNGNACWMAVLNLYFLPLPGHHPPHPTPSPGCRMPSPRSDAQRPLLDRQWRFGVMLVGTRG